MDDMKILVVDDEQPARKKLSSFIKAKEADALIEEAANGIEACEKIDSFKPFLIFLDIQMPGMTGLEVIQNCNPENLPPIVFVTAYDQYAIKAFEINAIDYLLKPFDEDRFNTAFDRALERLNRENKSKINGLLAEIRKDNKYLERILVSHRGKYFFIPADDIIFFSAEEKYVELHTVKGDYLIRETISGLENKLNTNKFSRIHRSYIVNIAQIEEMQPWSHGDFIITLKTGDKLNMSRRYKDSLFSKDVE